MKKSKSIDIIHFGHILKLVTVQVPWDTLCTVGIENPMLQCTSASESNNSRIVREKEMSYDIRKEVVDYLNSGATSQLVVTGDNIGCDCPRYFIQLLKLIILFFNALKLITLRSCSYLFTKFVSDPEFLHIHSPRSTP